jgi:PhnB protein
MSDVQPIPDNYPQLTPYLCVDGAEEAITLYRTVFGATERCGSRLPAGRSGTPSSRSARRC